MALNPSRSHKTFAPNLTYLSLACFQFNCFIGVFARRVIVDAYATRELVLKCFPAYDEWVVESKSLSRISGTLVKVHKKGEGSLITHEVRTTSGSTLMLILGLFAAKNASEDSSPTEHCYGSCEANGIYWISHSIQWHCSVATLQWNSLMLRYSSPGTS